MQASATSWSALGICADSSSTISTLFGLSIISSLVAVSPTPSFNFITPADSSKSKALASFVTSFGTAILSPLDNTSTSFVPL